ncbi:hypothetical protein Smic_54520 [Streptomyces microflavus]|uniref:Uncharacterized protein n=1 Tax=Streptomyces microflavus TaxID=1919 RepID=A0A7J0CWI5_STRMI|nr:hypothetical protein Smic_54520 [Streptomyces microflavus]
MPVGHGDDAGIPPLERGDHFGEPEDGGLPTGTALPVEAHDPFEILGHEVPHMPHGHAPALPSLRRSPS